MARRLRGKVAIVTGATRGIGLAIGKRLAEEGAKVCISSRKQENVNEALKILKGAGLDVMGMASHFGNPQDRKKLIEEVVNKYGGIDIVVQSTSVNPYFDDPFKISSSAWDKIFEVNVKSTYFFICEVTPYMEKRGGGSILVVSSTSAFTQSKIAPYAISKLAQIGIVRSLSSGCIKKNIRINCIAPGLINTRFLLSNFDKLNYNTSGQLDFQQPLIPRYGEPEECAGAAAFLVSDEASYITGEILVIGGGIHPRL